MTYLYVCLHFHFSLFTLQTKLWQGSYFMILRTAKYLSAKSEISKCHYLCDVMETLIFERGSEHQILLQQKAVWLYHFIQKRIFKGQNVG